MPVPHLLMLHGNGGSQTRFLPFLSQVKEDAPDIKVYLPTFSGFDGRPLPQVRDYWDLFLSELQETLPDEPFVAYGHGIGGSILLEWAARDYTFPDGTMRRPQQMILHSIIGASLHKRSFPKLMKPKWIRNSMRQAVAAPVLQPMWEKRLFQQPAEIPPELRRQFFADYGTCQAFSVFFDLITPSWYRSVQQAVKDQPFYFLWGEQERVVRSTYLPLWQADFPQATFEVVPAWDHFPMLDDPPAFSDKLIELVHQFA